MILQAGGSTSTASGACGDCGAPASGNFCSSCGADLRQSALGFLGPAVSPVRRSFPVVYLKLLRAPIRGTVAFAEDRTYRNYIAFALSGIAIYCLFIVPVVMNMIVPAGGPVHVSDSMLTLMKALSQIGVYVGIIITFLLAYGVFRLFARAKRPFHAYFKLFCIALGFTAPINGAYEFVVTRAFHGTGMTAFNFQLTPEALLTPTGLSTLTLLIVMLVYYIGIHRRFWEMPVWLAAPLYLVTSWVSNQIGYYVMWWVGFYAARVLIAAGVVTT
jgi:hypothetical protein